MPRCSDANHSKLLHPGPQTAHVEVPSAYV